MNFELLDSKRSIFHHTYSIFQKFRQFLLAEQHLNILLRLLQQFVNLFYL